MSQSGSPSEFLVISRGQWDPNLPPEEIQATIDQFYDWIGGNIDEGKMRGGQRLGHEGKTVSRAGVTDGPFGESKEVIGGYWYILAENLEAAAELVRGNPCLQCGLFFEIRPTDPERANAFVTMTETPLERRPPSS